MKKVLALTLSAVLAMGAATTAFAATFVKPNTTDYSYLTLTNDDDDDTFEFVDGSKEKMEWDTEYSFQISLTAGQKAGLHTLVDEDGDIVGAWDCEKPNPTHDDVLWLKENNKEFKNLDTDKVDVGSYVNTMGDLFELVDAKKATLKVDLTAGRDYVDSIKVADSGEEMYLNITTIDTQSTKDGEIAFELELKSRGTNSDFKTRTYTVKKQKIGHIVAEGKQYDNAMEVKADGTILDTDGMEACEDYEITWGEDTLAMFVVDIDDNDGKKNLSYTTAPVDALIEANPEANMDFFTLKAAPRFNKIGEMTIYADGDVFKYIYEVDKDGQLKEVNATYDEDEEGFVFKTRQLGSYVMSDIELVGAAIDEEVPGESDTEVPGESDTTDDGRDNPETGANDMVNVAAAMAVVSLAAAGAVAFKKSSK